MKKIKLGKILDVKRGTSLSGEYYAEQGDKIRLTLGNFDYPAGGFKENTSKKDIYFTGEIKPEFILKKGDIITPLTEQVSGLIGETARIPEDDIYVQSGDIGLVIPNEAVLDKSFAYYLIASPLVKKQLGAAAQQTKIRHTSPEKIKECEVWLPKVEYQINAGAVLDAINEKIINNSKVNAQLEAMAKTIYDYWFLQFDFPDKNGKPYKSSGGKMMWDEKLKREIPEGWNVKKIGDILNKIPSTKKYKSDECNTEGTYPIVDQSSDYICGYTDDEAEVLSLEDCVVFGDHTKYVKYVNFSFARGADGTQILNSVDPNMPNYLLYRQILDMDLVSQGYSRYFKFLKDRYVIIPSEDIAIQYIKYMKDMLERIKNSIIENRELASLRDFLLPLLMNGQVRFKED